MSLLLRFHHNRKMQKKPHTRQTTRKIPRKISKTYLENAALHYLQRYATSSANLRRVMMRKIEKSCKHHETDAADFIPLLDDMLARYAATGLLNDQVYAEARTASLRRKGESKGSIQARLSLKGLTRDQIAGALATADEGKEEPELEAARAFTRRKKIGPYRSRALQDPKDAQREMAAMARGGFSYDVAKRALQMRDEEDNQA
jgi:regulatory protein